MLTLLSCTQNENKIDYIPKPSPPSGYITKSYNYDLGNTNTYLQTLSVLKLTSIIAN